MNTSDVIALSSAIVAGCALGATFWQGWQSRCHDRLSVRPLLVWNERRNVTPDGVVVTFAISNHGLGPALIRKRFFKVGGDVIPDHGYSLAVVESVAQQVLGGRVDYRLLRTGLPGVGSAMLSQTEYVVAEALLIGQEISALKELFESFPVVDFVVEYESLYGERLKLSAINGQLAD